MKLRKWMRPTLFKKAYDKYNQEDMDIYAGYATLFILMAAVPLLMLIISVINVMPWFSPVEFSNTLFTVLPDIPAVKKMVFSVIRNLNAQSTGALVSASAIMMLWSASSGMTAIQKGLKKITPGAVSEKSDRLKALLYTLLFILVEVAMIIFGVLGKIVERLGFTIAINFDLQFLFDHIALIMHISEAITFVGVIIVIALMYHYLPGGHQSFRQQIPGAALATIFWVVFTILFSIFITVFWKASAIYGSLAAVFMIALWLRFIIIILFMGAGYNQVLVEEAAAESSSDDGQAEHTSDRRSDTKSVSDRRSAAKQASDRRPDTKPTSNSANYIKSAPPTSSVRITSAADRTTSAVDRTTPSAEHTEPALARTTPSAEHTESAAVHTTSSTDTLSSDAANIMRIGAGMAIMGILGIVGFLRQKD